MTRAVHRAYARPDNPLFVPEERFRPGNLFWALGRHRAIGQATFGVDAVRPQSELAQAYALLTPMIDLIAAAQAEDRIAGVLIEGAETQTIVLGGLTLTVRGADAHWTKVRLDAGQQAPPPPPAPPSEIDGAAVAPDQRPYGLIIATGPGEYIVVGRGFILDASRDGRPVELDRIEEGNFVDGRWVAGRWLNGDEYGQAVPRYSLRAAKVRFSAER